nr:MAG TPA: hypothetical protein [Caudoviricetes sp.]
MDIHHSPLLGNAIRRKTGERAQCRIHSYLLSNFEVCVTLGELIWSNGHIHRLDVCGDSSGATNLVGTRLDNQIHVGNIRVVQQSNGLFGEQCLGVTYDHPDCRRTESVTNLYSEVRTFRIRVFILILTEFNVPTICLKVGYHFCRYFNSEITITILVVSRGLATKIEEENVCGRN